MHRNEIHKLDFDQTYPCPCCRGGTLLPITLTEAWGCDHCKEIFELRGESNTIGKLTSPQRRQRIWRWNGKQWIAATPMVRPTVVDFAIVVVLLLALFWMGPNLTANVIASLIIRLVALILLALVVRFWLVFRR